MTDRPPEKELLKLPSGRRVEVAKILLSFSKWSGQPIPNTYGNKAVLDWKGEPLFAELAILRLFQSEAWDGVWIDTFRGKYRIGLPGVVEPVELPRDKEQLIESITRKAGKSGGCWDLFLWKGDVILFLEVKRQKKDRIRPSQLQWLQVSLDAGLSPNSFAVIEWDCVGDGGAGSERREVP